MNSIAAACSRNFCWDQKKREILYAFVLESELFEFFKAKLLQV